MKSYRQFKEILDRYGIDFKERNNAFYNDILLVLYHYKNKSSRQKYIAQQIKEHKYTVADTFIDEVASLEEMDGFGSFSLKFINEVLEQVDQQGKTYHEALESLGYFSKYVGMPAYDYLPPLEPTEKDIKWLQNHLQYFQRSHIFYQPMISPKVKRVVAVLRKLINEIIKRYGHIDEIRIETARELNSEREEKRIKEAQSKNKKKNDDAKRFLEANNLKISGKNLDRAKLFIEQGKCTCLYSGTTITLDEAFDENETEVEHFIPRSVIWINAYKNKILVKKEANQNKIDQSPVSYLKSIGEWENFKGRVQSSFMDKQKKEWLSNEENIENVMAEEYWRDRYMNDTNTAIKVIQKYLNHYLYPAQKEEYRKDEQRHIFSVSGRAINELKHLWGISEVMPKNEEGKKDRMTNYHHTLDAFAVALCSPTAINTLHNHFKKKENKFKNKAQKEKLENSVPVSKDGISVVTYFKEMVKQYEENRRYVCPYNKRKTNMKGFKDSNLKLYITQDPTDKSKEILAEMEKVYIDQSLLSKKVNGFDKPRNDKEVLKEIASIQDRLDRQKQGGIIAAIEIYASELLELRTNIQENKKEIDALEKKKKTSKNAEAHNEKIEDQIKVSKQKGKELSERMKSLQCSFEVKGGKRQIVRALNLPKSKVELTKADAMIFPKREGEKITRLTVQKFRSALNEKEPFVVKMNELNSTLNVQLFSSTEKGQVVGLNFFSSISNDFPTRINERYKDAKLDNNDCLVLYKNDLIKVTDYRKNKIEYFIFNGGGNVTGSNNQVSVRNINHSIDAPNISIGVNNKNNKEVCRIDIDFFGNIREV
ncbi:MAG TPA: type II CRISPR RNA-guided endonuclease Cas9 [Caldithrix sp.]|nr:type II CRISPR RNA-guided endonuclease Cas9 [Caldithrix sp.]